jgi:hypothetical protein
VSDYPSLYPRSFVEEVDLDLVRRRWRVGRKIGRTVYAVMGEDPLGDVPIGMLDSPLLAAAAVEAHNAALDEAAP